jgi:hypothetical protein
MHRSIGWGLRRALPAVLVVIAGLAGAADARADEPPAPGPSPSSPAAAEPSPEPTEPPAPAKVTVSLTKPPALAEAGKKAYVRGVVSGEPGAKVHAEAWNGDSWVRVASAASHAKTGAFTLRLRHKEAKVGTVRYRVVTESSVGTRKSEKFTLERLGWRAKITPTKKSEVTHTYRKGCSVGPGKLSTITMTYRGYDGLLHTGVLIVHKDVAKKVRDAFKEAFEGGFRVYRMDNPDLWKGNDIKIMKANNTSAYNCRKVTGNPSKVSPHSFGRSIDVNPAQNPYLVGGTWYPSATYGKDRPEGVTGMLYKDGPMVKALEKRGFRWYSGWDWHHFQK